MCHRTARLTPFGRGLLVRRVLEDSWPMPVAAGSLGVSRATAYKWLGRYRREGPAGLADRPSRAAAVRVPCRRASRPRC